MKFAAVFLGIALGLLAGGMLMGGSPSEWGARSGCGCEDLPEPIREPAAETDLVDEIDS